MKKKILLFIFILVLFQYALLKAFIYYGILSNAHLFGIDHRIALTIITLVIVLVVGLPTSKLYYFVMGNLGRYLTKHIPQEVEIKKK